MLRDEVRTLTFNIVAKQLYLAISTFNTGHSEYRLDLIFRFLILSSKNRILKKLNRCFVSEARYQKLQRDWSLCLLDSEDYKSLQYLVGITGSDKGKYSAFYRTLSEHLVIKISNILLYELFLSKKIPDVLLEIYTVDIFVLLLYKDLLYFYVVWRIRLKGILTLPEQDRFSNYLCSFTKKGITLKYIALDNIDYKTKFISPQFFIIPSLKLLDRLVVSLLKFFVKR